MKIRWSTTGDYPLYPFLVESKLFFGKNKYVSDDHQMKYLSSTINQILNSVINDKIPIKGIYFSLMDNYGFASATHYTDGLA
jgi:hypothetical protein